METVRGGALKRPLDEDDDGDDNKKLKTGPDIHQFMPTVENIKAVNDVNKWNLLPSIVYELLALFKKSEKVNSNDDNQDKIDDIKNDNKVLPNQNCLENLSDNAIKHENLKEVDVCDKISIENSNVQVSNTTIDNIKNLDKLDFSEKYTTENIPKQIPLFTKASPVKLFVENTNVNKTKQAEYESNGKTSVVKEEQLTSVENVGNLFVSSKNVHCIDSSTNDISKAVMSTENNSSAATSANSIYNTPMLTSNISITNTPILISTNSISNTDMLSSTNNNTLIVSKNNSHKDIISRTENTFRGQMLEFLNKNCLNGISGISLTKPSPCKCNCCTVVNNLPIEKSAVYNLFFASSDNLNYTNLHSDVNSLNLPVTGCSIYTANHDSENKSNIPHKFNKTLINIDTPKNIWVNELTSLIIKNENTSKIHLATNTNHSKKLNPMQSILNKMHKDTQHISKNENTSQIHLTTKTNDSKKLNPVQNVINKVHKTTQHIKSHFSLCKKCKKSKYSRSDSCKCHSRSYKHKYDKY